MTDFLKNFKNSVSIVADTISSTFIDATTRIVDSNKTNAQLIRLRAFIKTETEILNRAYIQLGKYYFENQDSINTEDIKDILGIIQNSKSRIEKAQNLYASVYNSSKANKAKQNSTTVAEPEPAKEVKTQTAIDSKILDNDEQVSAQIIDDTAEFLQPATDIATESYTDDTESIEDNEFTDDTELTDDIDNETTEIDNSLDYDEVDYTPDVENDDNDTNDDFLNDNSNQRTLSEDYESQPDNEDIF